MRWRVEAHEVVSSWLESLAEEDPATFAKVMAALRKLETVGPTLGRPVADRIKGSELHNLKELRPAGTSIRILFIFGPSRAALLLVAGDKAGNWRRWYRTNIPIAERRYRTWTF